MVDGVIVLWILGGVGILLIAVAIAILAHYRSDRAARIIAEVRAATERERDEAIQAAVARITEAHRRRPRTAGSDHENASETTHRIARTRL